MQQTDLVRLQRTLVPAAPVHGQLRSASSDSCLQVEFESPGERVGERQQQLGTIGDRSWFCKDLLADGAGMFRGFLAPSKAADERRMRSAMARRVRARSSGWAGSRALSRARWPAGDRRVPKAVPAPGDCPMLRGVFPASSCAGRLPFLQLGQSQPSQP